MMCIQNKETFKRTLLRSGMLVCLFLAGCGDRNYYLGQAHMEKGLYDRAISDFNKAIEIDPKHAMAYNNRGNAYNAKGLYDLAISDFDKALEINPRYATAYNNRGYAYNAKGLYDLAISDFNKALEINPRYADAYNNRGHAYYNKQEHDKTWEDVHNTQGLGYQVHPESLKCLREASGREKGGSQTAPADP